MAAVTLIPTAVHGNQQAVFPIAAGTPAHVQLDLVSPDFPTDATLTFDLAVEQSLDNGTTFAPWFGARSVGGGQGQPGKGGVPMDGLLHEVVQFDGLARTARVTITVNRPFSWGLTATVLAT